MAWSLPRLLRRLEPELAHFQHALPLGWRGGLSSRCTTCTSSTRLT